jgi:heme-degrading monooxygenase HmoA
LYYAKERKEQILIQFSHEYASEIEGFKGFIIMDSTNDSQEVITLTFWERKEDRDRYHTLSNVLVAKITSN